MAWLKGLEPPEALRSPLDHASTRPKAIAIEARKPAPAAVDPLDGVTLSGVIGTGDGGMASIDGVLFKVGEEIRPGVTLVAVEPRQSAVVVRLSDGTERRLQRADRPRTSTHRH
ncbi:hypothetical protein J4558_19200 [Leptolyngbya sp. 15MV]|nr:hypothetical protein J4558_19200 [Leptolyngbya sp. 15MV]